jgi:hypothetical protein
MVKYGAAFDIVIGLNIKREKAVDNQQPFLFYLRTSFKHESFTGPCFVLEINYLYFTLTFINGAPS